jgi:predicted kinase
MAMPESWKRAMARVLLKHAGAGKVCLIMSGLPGSGKSSLASLLPGPRRVCSADDFHTGEDGVYRYDPRRANEAHDDCLAKALAAFQGAEPLVVIDNTNTRAWELAVYYRLAQVFGYSAVILRVHCDPAVAFARNTHGVPARTIMDMSRSLSEMELPSWWQVEWFLPDVPGVVPAPAVPAAADGPAYGSGR